MKAPQITQEQLRRLLSYDPETGVFTWLVQRPGRSKVGTPAGSDRAGYIQIGIYRRLYCAHSLAWLYVYGVFPTMLDHINGVTGDNRICNLRLADNTTNQWNRKTQRNNSSGHVGVYRYRGQWVARITVHKKHMWLGAFDDKQAAINCYMESARKHFGEWVRQA